MKAVGDGQYYPERNAEIMRRWRAGESAKTIAEALRGSLTRSAVIGVVHRARDRGEDVARELVAASPGGRNGGRSKKSPREKMPSKPQRLVPSLFFGSDGRMGTGASRPPLPVPTGRHDVALGEPGAVGRRVATLALRNGQCRFPVGDTRSPEFRYCCARIAQGSYCEPHARLCYTPLRGA